MIVVLIDLKVSDITLSSLSKLRYFTMSLIWLRENFGESGDGKRWTFKAGNENPAVYYFKNLDDALLFKLTWGGNI